MVYADLSLDRSLFSPEDKILLAVSGGVDSMVMLDLFLKEKAISLGMAHVNYHLRGADSDEDELWVKAVAKRYDLPIHIRHAHIKKGDQFNPTGIQVMARDIRYTFFEEIRKEYGYNKIATAHNQLDRIETFLFNLSRGSGLNGLSSIPAVNGFIIRPMLHLTKQQILAYAHKNQVGFRVDKSNLEPTYTRNKIRLNLIPEFEKIHPRATSNISSTIELLNKYKELLHELLAARKEKWITETKFQTIVHLDKLPPKHLSVILYELLIHTRITSTQISDMVQAYKLQSRGALFYTPTHTIGFNQSDLIIDLSQDWTVSTQIFPGLNPIISRDSYLDVRKTGFPERWPVQQHIAYLNGDKLEFPLGLRSWKPGDRFQPLGMGGKTKKVQDFLTDLKVPRIEKMKIMVMTSGDDICWVVGCGISELFKTSRSDEHIYRFELIKD